PLRLVAGGDAAGRFRQHRDDGDGPAPQLGPVLLLHRGEEGVHVDEQIPKWHRPPLSARVRCWDGSDGKRAPAVVSREVCSVEAPARPAALAPGVFSPGADAAGLATDPLSLSTEQGRRKVSVAQPGRRAGPRKRGGVLAMTSFRTPG